VLDTISPAKLNQGLPREILIYRVLIPFKHPFKTVFKSGIVYNSCKRRFNQYGLLFGTSLRAG
jgi:hypothetical protein